VADDKPTLGARLGRLWWLTGGAGLAGPLAALWYMFGDVL